MPGRLVNLATAFSDEEDLGVGMVEEAGFKRDPAKRTEFVLEAMYGVSASKRSSISRLGDECGLDGHTLEDSSPL